MAGDGGPQVMKRKDAVKEMTPEQQITKVSNEVANLTNVWGKTATVEATQLPNLVVSKGTLNSEVYGNLISILGTKNRETETSKLMELLKNKEFA